MARGKITRAMSELESRLGRMVAEITSKVRNISAIGDFDYETSESKKTFYLFSLMLIIYIVFFSPDKISQLIGSVQGDAGLFERIVETVKVIKRLIPF